MGILAKGDAVLRGDRGDSKIESLTKHRNRLRTGGSHHNCLGQLRFWRELPLFDVTLVFAEERRKGDRPRQQNNSDVFSLHRLILPRRARRQIGSYLSLRATRRHGAHVTLRSSLLQAFGPNCPHAAFWHVRVATLCGSRFHQCILLFIPRSR